MDFDFDSIKLSPTFAAGIRVEKLITTIPVRKPNADEFYRVRDDPEWTFSMYLLYLHDGEEEKYIVAKELISEVMSIGKLRPVMIHALITHTHKVFFLSDIPLPDPDGKENEYHRTRREAYAIATKKWVKIKANKPLAAYEIFTAKGKLSEPVWPQEPKTIIDTLKISFKDRVIDAIDPPVLKQLRGEL